MSERIRSVTAAAWIAAVVVAFGWGIAWQAADAEQLTVEGSSHAA
jgi:hypothetical protein